MPFGMEGGQWDERFLSSSPYTPATYPPEPRMSVQRKTLLLGLLVSSLAVAQSGPPRQPAAGAPAQPPAPAAASEPEAGEEARVISTQERFLPGSAPHSRST